MNGGGGGGFAGDITITLPGGAGVIEHVQTVAAAAVSAGQRVQLALAATLDEDENEPELMDVSSLSGRALAGQIEVTATFATRTSGPVQLIWSAI